MDSQQRNASENVQNPKKEKNAMSNSVDGGQLKCSNGAEEKDAFDVMVELAAAYGEENHEIIPKK